LARAGGWKGAVAIAAAAGAVAAGVFDVLENRAILRLLDVRLQDTTAAMLHAIRSPAVAKWWLTGIAIVLLCAHFAKPPAKA